MHHHLNLNWVWVDFRNVRISIRSLRVRAYPEFPRWNLEYPSLASWTRVTHTSLVCHITFPGPTRQPSPTPPRNLLPLLSLTSSLSPTLSLLLAMEELSPLLHHWSPTSPEFRRSHAGARRRRAAPPRSHLLGASPSFFFHSSIFLKPQASRATSSFTKPFPPSKNSCWGSTGHR